MSFSISAVNVSETPFVGSVTFNLKTGIVVPCTVEPGYNDIGLLHLAYNVRYSVAPVNSSLLILTLYCSVIITPVYNDTKCSAPFMTL